MKEVVPALNVTGSGLFMGKVIKYLKKKKLDVEVIGFEPWAESSMNEAKRVAKLLSLNTN